MKRLRVGLLGRTVGALVAVGLAPLAVVPYLINLNSQALTEQILRTHAVAARTAAARVGAFLDALQGSAEALAGSGEVYGNPKGGASQALLAGLLQANPSVAAIALTDPHEDEYVRVQSRVMGTVAEAVLAQPDPAAVSAWSEAQRLWLRLRVPLPEDRGHLTVVAEASALADVVRPEELGQEATLVLATRDGRVIASSTPGASLDSFPAALVAAARTGHASGATVSGADRVVGAYAPVPRSPWFVVSRQPARVAQEVALRMRRQAGLAVLVVVILALGITLFARHSIVQPLQQLVAAQRRLAGGAAAGHGGDEIRQLQSSFALLERQASDRDAIGKVFLGRYQVVDLLGTGGMGTVYRGWDPRLQRPVALKTVHRVDEAKKGPAPTDAASVAELLQEAVLVARFNHPNIVAVYDVEDAPAAAYIAMEMVDGKSLELLLADRGGMPASDAVPIAAGVARGLAAAHAHGVVHRDVKPGNVLLGHDGSIKVTDFGIAAPLAPGPQRSDSVFGTPGYIPPEALRGRGQGPLGDLFALGVLLYRMMAGRLPFTGRNIAEIVTSSMTLRPTPLRLAAPGTPQELEDFVNGLLSADPTLRMPQTATAAAEQLEAMAARHGWHWVPSHLAAGDPSTAPLVPEPTAKPIRLKQG